MSKRRESIFQMLMILAGLLIAFVVILFTSQTPAKALNAFFLKPFSNTTRLGNMISDGVPLIITGLAACVSFRASVWNLGTEGMAFFGMITGWLAMHFLSGLPALIAIPLGFAAAFVGGAFLAWISTYLYKRFGCNMMMSSLLISNIMIDMCMLFVESSKYYDPNSGMGIATYQLPKKFLFTGILGKSDLDTGLYIALAIFLIIALLLNQTRLGYRIRITGNNTAFARYGGISTASIAVLAMVLCGGLAGIGGIVYVLSDTGRVLNTFSNIGWTGVSVAMIARKKPGLVIPVAMFIAYIHAGAQQAQLAADIGPTIAQIIEGAVLLFVTSTSLLAMLSAKRKIVKEAGVEVRA